MYRVWLLAPHTHIVHQEEPPAWRENDSAPSIFANLHVHAIVRPAMPAEEPVPRQVHDGLLVADNDNGVAGWIKHNPSLNNLFLHLHCSRQMREKARPCTGGPAEVQGPHYAH